MIKRFKQLKSLQLTRLAQTDQFTRAGRHQWLTMADLKRAVVLWGVAFLIMLGGNFYPDQLATATSTQVWQLQLRDEKHRPLAGVECEILSYDWGRPSGQPYAVIARGQTNQAGLMAFEVSTWPRSGYQLRVGLPRMAGENINSAQPYHSEPELFGRIWLTIGGHSEQIALVLDSNGQLYLDRPVDSTGGEISQPAKTEASGPDQPHTTPVPSATWLAQATNRLDSKGGPQLVVYPAPFFGPTPSGVQTALALTSQESAPLAYAAPPNAKTQRLQNQSDLGESLLLALVGLGSLALFWKLRLKLYGWLGLTITHPVKSKSKPTKVRTTKLLVRGTRAKLANSTKTLTAHTQRSQTKNREATPLGLAHPDETQTQTEPSGTDAIKIAAHKKEY